MPAWCHTTTNKPFQQNMLGVWFKRVIYMVTYRYLLVLKNCVFVVHTASENRTPYPNQNPRLKEY